MPRSTWPELLDSSTQLCAREKTATTARSLAQIRGDSDPMGGMAICLETRARERNTTTARVRTIGSKACSRSISSLVALSGSSRC